MGARTTNIAFHLVYKTPENNYSRAFFNLKEEFYTSNKFQIFFISFLSHHFIPFILRL